MCPQLVRKGIVRWQDLVVAGVVHLEHLDVIAYTYKLACDMDVRMSDCNPWPTTMGIVVWLWIDGGGLGAVVHFALYATKLSGVAAADFGSVATFQSLVFTIVGFGFHSAGFMEITAHWGGWMGHPVGSKLCPLCHKLEDHEHVLRHCRFSAFIFDTMQNAFGVVQREGGGVEPSCFLFVFRRGGFRV